MSGNRSNFKAKPNSITNKPPRKLHLETLEDRLAPASLPIDLVNHLSHLVSSLGITQITAQPPAPREVIGSVHLKLAPSGLVWDPVEGSLPSEPVTAPIDDPLEENPASPEDPTATQPPEGPFEQPNQKPGIDPIQGIGIINPALPGLPNLDNVPEANPGQGNDPANGLNPGAGNQLPGGGANQPGAGGNLPGGGANQPGAGGNLPGGGGILPGGGANLPGGSFNPGFNIPGGGYLPTNGNNPINPATGSPFWPNPGPMPGPGINPGAGNPPASDPNPGTTTPGTGTAPSGPTDGSGTPSKNLQVSGIDPDTGSSNSDRITKAQSPSVVGTAPANSQITILSAGSVIGRGTADASGKFKAPIFVALADGVHMLQVACNQASSASLQVTIDTKAPAPTISSTRWVPEKVNLEVKLGWATGSDTTGTISLDVDLNQNGSYEENELAYRTGTADSVFVLNNLNGYGDYTLRARAVDTAGNVGTATALSFVDRNAGFVGDDSLRKMAQGAFEALGYTGLWDGRALQLDPSWAPSDTKLLTPVHITTRTGIKSLFDDYFAEMKKIGLTDYATNSQDGLVEGYLPAFRVLALPSLPAFSTASMNYKTTFAGTVQNEGVPVMQVPQYWSSTGYTGLGMKIGVLSDSANSTGALTNAQATGNLPQNVQIITDMPSGQGSDEGTAMMEVAYDVAPGSSLAFASAFVGGPQGFADGILALSAVGCNTIVDDVTYFNSPIYNEGRIALAINEVVFNQDKFYCGAAGNQTDNGYRGVWKSSTSSIAGGSISGTFMDFGGTPYQIIYVATNTDLQVSIKWDSAYLEGGSSLPNFQVPNVVYAYLVDLSTNAVVATANDDNLNTDMAWQLLGYTNSGTNTQFGIAYQLISGPEPTRLGWTAYGPASGVSLFPNGNGGCSISNTALAKGSVAVAAASWQTPTVPEDFTSKGGVLEFLFDAAGNRLSTPYTFFKPQITAPDGISTTLPANSGLNPFYGTSCAAPQVAAVAALIWGNQPNLTRDQLTFHLYATAIDIYSPGQDDLTGAGLIQAVPVPSDAFGTGDISNNSLTAWHLGVVGSAPIISPYLDISNQAGLPDYDWFTLRAGQAGKLNLRMIQGSSGSLEVRLFTLDQNMHLVERASSTKPNQFFRTLSMDVFANELVYIEVKGRNSSYGVMDEAFYQMTLKIS